MELAMEEESGTCAHCRRQGEFAVRCIGHLGAWMQHMLLNPELLVLI